MLLCLDVGNTQIHGGVFNDNQLVFQFRRSTSKDVSSDEIGVFLRATLRENLVDPEKISDIAVCSVVPHMNYSLKSACVKYFTDRVMFVKPGLKTGLHIKYLNPAEVGADRIVNGVAARSTFPDQNIIIVDFGTATTLDAISKEGDYLGGAIIGGAKLMVSALESKTARLPSVQIQKPTRACGVTTVESIQSGLYWATYGGVKELIRQITTEQFKEFPLIVGTGGVAKLYEDSDLFQVYKPSLVLEGLQILHVKNMKFKVG